LNLPDEVFELRCQGREKKWLDDLVQCILSPLSGLNESLISMAVVRRCIRMGFVFCYEKELQNNGKVCTTWCKGRANIQEDSIKGHLNALTELPELQNIDKTDSAAVADHILKQLGDDQGGFTPLIKSPSSNAMEHVMATYTEDQQFILQMFSAKEEFW
jgi:hypothetical protein